MYRVLQLNAFSLGACYSHLDELEVSGGLR